TRRAGSCEARSSPANPPRRRPRPPGPPTARDNLRSDCDFRSGECRTCGPRFLRLRFRLQILRSLRLRLRGQLGLNHAEQVADGHDLFKIAAVEADAKLR